MDQIPESHTLIGQQNSGFARVIHRLRPRDTSGTAHRADLALGRQRMERFEIEF